MTAARPGRIGPADEKVGQARVGGVVRQRGPVDPRSRAAPPPTRRATGAALSHSYCPPACRYTSASPRSDRHDLRARRNRRHELRPANADVTVDHRGGPAAAGDQPRRSQPAAAGRAGHAAEDCGPAARPRRRPIPGRRRRGRATRDRPAPPPPTTRRARPNRCGPVRRTPGSVERVDDPHPVGGQPARVVPALLGKHRVAGAVIRERPRDQTVRTASPASRSRRGRRIRSRPAGPSIRPCRRRRARRQARRWR